MNKINNKLIVYNDDNVENALSQFSRTGVVAFDYLGLKKNIQKKLSDEPAGAYEYEIVVNETSDLFWVGFLVSYWRSMNIDSKYKFVFQQLNKSNIEIRLMIAAMEDFEEAISLANKICTEKWKKIHTAELFIDIVTIAAKHATEEDIINLGAIYSEIIMMKNKFVIPTSLLDFYENKIGTVL